MRTPSVTFGLMDRSSIMIVAGSAGAGLLIACGIWLTIPQRYTCHAELAVTWHPEIDEHIRQVKAAALQHIAQTMWRGVRIRQDRISPSAEKWTVNIDYPSD